MKYYESIEYLESFWKFGIKLGLSRIEHLLEILGNPQNKFKAIHIAGTNGKGSVCAMTESVLRAAGYRTGLYTSPHLKYYTERIKINGKDISRAKFALLVAKVKAAVEARYSIKELPTEFELLTAAAFLSFAEEKVDIAVIETGLGGRLDSTNVIKPLVCAITNVAFDHCGILGRTLGSIAKEKAGIIKRGIPVITACDKPQTIKVIRDKCKKMRTAVTTCGFQDADVTVERLGNTESGQTINVFAKDRDIRGLYLPFFGAHQAVNAAVAIALSLEVQDFSASGLQHKKYSISDKAIRKGFARASWPARYQVINKEPLVVLDGAHNPSGIKALFKELSDVKKEKLIAVVGILKDKDHLRMIREIAHYAEIVVAVAPDSPRACPPEIIAAEARKCAVTAFAEHSPEQGLEKALSLASPSDVVCVCGSLYCCAGILKTRI